MSGGAGKKLYFSFLIIAQGFFLSWTRSNKFPRQPVVVVASGRLVVLLGKEFSPRSGYMREQLYSATILSAWLKLYWATRQVQAW